MPGAYAHITLVNQAREPARLDAIDEFPDEGKRIAAQNLNFLELGAVSPDYPYLAILDGDSGAWADLMHYVNTGGMIQEGIRRARELDGLAQEKCLAWLMGYVAHVATDVTIHPVVQLKVGPYEQNKGAHRHCEMHQDVHIYQRLNLGPMDLSEHLKSGIQECSHPENEDAVNEDVATLWRAMMEQIHPAEFDRNPPDIDKWHVWFRRLVDNIAEEGGALVALARHVATGLDLVYPLVEDLEMEFIEELETPNGIQHYDAIFDLALENVCRLWGDVTRAVLEGDDTYLTAFGNWNLDTGEDENGELVLWA